MGKFYTFINKGKVNKKIPTEDLQLYLKDGWKTGLWNQEEINRKAKMGLEKKLQKMKEDGTLDLWNKEKSEKVSAGLKSFWSSVGDEYKQQREKKKMASRSKWSETERTLFHNKMSCSAKANRVTITPEEYKRRSELSTITKKKNGTFATSSFENNCYSALIESYGRKDVVREYRTDDRYPFSCVFYIPSKDLFIELNIHPSHYTHPFDESNEEDSILLHKFRTSTVLWDKMIADVWGDRDRKKHAIAKENNLNYIAVYKTDFEQFIQKIKEKAL